MLLTLTAAACFGAGLGTGWLLWGRRDRPPSMSTAPGNADIEGLVFALVNKERAAHGLGGVRPEAGLANVARFHSLDMLRRRFMAHDNPDGEAPADRVARGHRTLLACKVAENLASLTSSVPDSPQEAASRLMDGWMKSPGHRANILDRGVDSLGVGIIQQGGEVRGTQVFAKHCGYLRSPLPATATTVGINVTIDSAPGQPKFWTTAASQDSPTHPYRPGQVEPVPAGRHQLHVYYHVDGTSYRGAFGPSFVVR